MDEVTIPVDEATIPVDETRASTAASHLPAAATCSGVWPETVRALGSAPNWRSKVMTGARSPGSPPASFAPVSFALARKQKEVTLIRGRKRAGNVDVVSLSLYTVKPEPPLPPQ